MTKTHVVSARLELPNTVSVMRPTLFGNPFPGSMYGRAEAVKRYETYFHDRLTRDAFFAMEVENLRGKVITCVCAGRPCHAYVIADHLNATEKKEKHMPVATAQGKQHALREWKKRSDANKEKDHEAINDRLPAGSPMYFGCKGCNASISVPESYTSRPQFCAECEALKTCGWFGEEPAPEQPVKADPTP